jgi:hypothetical protein
MAREWAAVSSSPDAAPIDKAVAMIAAPIAFNAVRMADSLRSPSDRS